MAANLVNKFAIKSSAYWEAMAEAQKCSDTGSAG